MQVEPVIIGSVDYSSLDGIFGNSPVGLVCEDIAFLFKPSTVKCLDERDYEIKAVLGYYNSLELRGEMVSDFIRHDLGHYAFQTAHSIQQYLMTEHAFPTDVLQTNVIRFTEHYSFVSELMLDSLADRARRWVSNDTQYLIQRTPDVVLDSMLHVIQKRYDKGSAQIHTLLVGPLLRYEVHGEVRVLQDVVDYLLKN